MVRMNTERSGDSQSTSPGACSTGMRTFWSGMSSTWSMLGHSMSAW